MKGRLQRAFLIQVRLLSIAQLQQARMLHGMQRLSSFGQLWCRQAAACFPQPGRGACPLHSYTKSLCCMSCSGWAIFIATNVAGCSAHPEAAWREDKRQNAQRR
jgi:hypothetical protein